MHKGHNDTAGTATQTIDNTVLGQIEFAGASTSNAFADGATIRAQQNGTSGSANVPTELYLETSSASGINTNQMVLGSGGEVGIGGIAGSGVDLNVFASGEAHLWVNSHTNAAEGSNIRLLHSRNTTIGQHTAVAQHDIIGQIVWAGSDGDNYEGACAIRGSVDEGVADGDMPGRLTFHTSSDGTANLLERLRIDRVGTVFCNTATTNEKIRLEGTTDPYIRWCESTTNRAYIQWSTSGYLLFANQEHSEYFVIADNGVGIGLVNPAHKIDVVGTAGLSTGTAWTNTSDSRIKTNIETISDGLDKINQLRPVSFNYTDEYLEQHSEIDSTRRYNSFLAQEYAEVFPDAVNVGNNLEKIITKGVEAEDAVFDEDGNEISPAIEAVEEVKEVLVEDVLQFTPHDLNMYLVKAVQELSAKVEALENAGE